MRRLYSLTDAGRKAWDTQSSRVPLDSRRVLGIVGTDSDPRDLCAKLGWSESAVREVLEALERGGMVKSVGAERTKDDLDFTDSFRLADLQAAAQGYARKDLDFTQPLSEEDLRAAREKK
jgi:DNA-binding MarR family transcriptional regulator